MGVDVGTYILTLLSFTGKEFRALSISVIGMVWYGEPLICVEKLLFHALF